jgi:hypothetical protein
MSQYRVLTDRCELPAGAAFTTAPATGAPGELVLLQIGDNEANLAVGRFYPDAPGRGLITMPRLLIAITGEVPIRVLGRVIRCEDLPAELGDLTEDECERALKIARALK